MAGLTTGIASHWLLQRKDLIEKTKTGLTKLEILLNFVGCEAVLSLV